MSTSIESLYRDGDIDFRVVAGRLRAGWRWIAISAVATTVVFAATAFLMTPIYRATIVFVAADTGRSNMGSLGASLGELGGLASLVGLTLTPEASHTEESLAVLRSREFTERFIRDRGLMPELFHRRWDEKSGTWKQSVTRQPTLAEAYRYFDKRVREISHDKKTGLISLEIEWRDPDKAAEWANELVARLNAEMRARAIADSTASVGFLQKELADTSTVDTRAAINRLIEAQIKQRMLANVTREYAFRVVDRALPPDARDVVRPKKLLMIVLGAGLGLMMGALAVLLRGAVGSDSRRS